MPAYKNRELVIGDIVEVYRNLHKECLSVRKDGLVHLHADAVYLKNANFIVSQSGRNRVLDTKKKNVHAYVRGEVISYLSDMECIEHMYEEAESAGYTRIYYNPYKVNQFVNYKTMQPVVFAHDAYVIGDRIYAKV